MKLPRDISGVDLAKALGRLGYEITHQTGSHIRLTTQRGGEHHVAWWPILCISKGWGHDDRIAQRRFFRYHTIIATPPIRRGGWMGHRAPLCGRGLANYTGAC